MMFILRAKENSLLDILQLIMPSIFSRRLFAFASQIDMRLSMKGERAFFRTKFDKLKLIEEIKNLIEIDGRK